MFVCTRVRVCERYNRFTIVHPDVALEVLEDGKYLETTVQQKSCPPTTQESLPETILRFTGSLHASAPVILFIHVSASKPLGREGTLSCKLY